MSEIVKRNAQQAQAADYYLLSQDEQRVIRVLREAPQEFITIIFCATSMAEKFMSKKDVIAEIVKGLFFLPLFFATLFLMQFI